MHEQLMRFLRPSFRGLLLVAVCGLITVQQSWAGLIAGPVLNQADAGWIYAGIGFTANENTDLTGFIYQNQGQADTVILVDPLGNILDSVAIPVGVPSDTVS